MVVSAVKAKSVWKVRYSLQWDTVFLGLSIFLMDFVCIREYMQKRLVFGLVVVGLMNVLGIVMSCISEYNRFKWIKDNAVKVQDARKEEEAALNKVMRDLYRMCYNRRRGCMDKVLVEVVHDSRGFFKATLSDGKHSNVVYY